MAATRLIPRMLQRQMMENISVPTNAIQKLPMRNFFCLSASISISQADSRKMTLLPIRYDSPLSREKLLRKKRTRSVMKRQCAGQRENTPLLWQPTLTGRIFITISFTTRPRWIAPINLRIFSFPDLRFRG